jgi:hypothetical protein
MTSSNHGQRQRQEPNVAGDQYYPWPFFDMEINASPFVTGIYGNNHFYGSNSFNITPQVSYGQNTLAMAPVFAPQYVDHDAGQHVDQLNVTSPPGIYQGPPISTQLAHPSDIFGSLEEAMAAMPPRNWTCPTEDTTLPTSDEDRQQWVQELLEAVNNVTNIQGNKGNDFKKRWHHPETGLRDYYLSLDKLILCWKIEDLSERLHRAGPSALHSFDEKFWDSVERTQAWTFHHRMSRIVELLTVSKTRCDSLLGGGSLQNIVANPGARAVATRLQVKQNARRSQTLKAGRVAKKQKTSRRKI